MWYAVHAAGVVRGNLEPLVRLCEQLDEAADLRAKVVLTGAWRDRVGLRHLDAVIDAGLERLGIRSLLPFMADVAAESWAVKLAQLYTDGDGVHRTFDGSPVEDILGENR